MNENFQSASSKNVSPSRGFLRRFWPHITIGMAILGVISLLLPQSLFHSFNCQSSRLATTNRASNNLYLDNQVIVTGVQADVNAVVGPLGLILIEGCDLSYLNTRDNPNLNLTEEQRNSLVMQLYEIPRGSNVEDVITTINQTRTEQPELYIFVDPNYLVSLSDLSTDPCGRPNSDPGSGGGHPFGDAYIPDAGTGEARIAEGAFMNQWAFGSQGINLPSSPVFTGRGVRVAVFDTSPFRIRLPFFWRIGVALPSPMWFTGWDAAGATTVSNHGLFVAGLIHRIAPKSRIQLVQVLNDNGCGQLWALNKALEHYTSWMSGWTGNLNRTVINMSLGIRMANAA